MQTKLLLLFALVFGFLALLAKGQLNTPSVWFVSVDPAGGCGSTQYLEYNITNGNLWGCENGTWTVVSGGGGAACSGDINTGCSQVLATHLTAPLPILQGGTGATTLAAAGIVRGSAGLTNPNRLVCDSAAGTVVDCSAGIVDNGGGQLAATSIEIPNGFFITDSANAARLQSFGGWNIAAYNGTAYQVALAVVGNSAPVTIVASVPITYNINTPAANTVVCYKTGGVLGWASNTAGVIGTTCN